MSGTDPGPETEGFHRRESEEGPPVRSLPPGVSLELQRVSVLDVDMEGGVRFLKGVIEKEERLS